MSPEKQPANADALDIEQARKSFGMSAFILFPLPEEGYNSTRTIEIFDRNLKPESYTVRSKISTEEGKGPVEDLFIIRGDGSNCLEPSIHDIDNPPGVIHVSGLGSLRDMGGIRMDDKIVITRDGKDISCSMEVVEVANLLKEIVIAKNLSDNHSKKVVRRKRDGTYSQIELPKRRK